MIVAGAEGNQQHPAKEGGIRRLLFGDVAQLPEESQNSHQADDEKGDIGDDVPEIRNAPNGAGILELMIGWILRYGALREKGDDGNGGKTDGDGQAYFLLSSHANPRKEPALLYRFLIFLEIFRLLENLPVDFFRMLINRRIFMLR